MALLIGGIEALGLIGGHLKIHGPIWDSITSLNDSFGMIGFVIIGVFVMSWVISFFIYRLNRYDEIKLVSTPPD